jgi:hypothetical protein
MGLNPFDKFITGDDLKGSSPDKNIPGVKLVKNNLNIFFNCNCSFKLP